LDGNVIGKCLPRHRNEEFVDFLDHIDQQVPKDLDVHLNMDNYATHKHANVKAWLDEHPRYHVHFTPTSSSWLNLVERFFAEITNRRIRRGSFRSVRELTRAIDGYIADVTATRKLSSGSRQRAKFSDGYASANLFTRHHTSGLRDP